MKIDINVNVYLAGGADVASIKHSLASILTIGKAIMTTQAEAAAQINAVTEKLVKIGTETKSLLDKVAELEEVIRNQGNVSAEVETALGFLKAQAQTVDDQVKDLPAVQA